MHSLFVRQISQTVLNSVNVSLGLLPVPSENKANIAWKRHTPTFVTSRYTNAHPARQSTHTTLIRLSNYHNDSPTPAPPRYP